MKEEAGEHRRTSGGQCRPRPLKERGAGGGAEPGSLFAQSLARKVVEQRRSVSQERG